MNNLGAYLQTYKDGWKTENALKSFRTFYPDSPIYLVSDGGDDFSELANKYHCFYEHSDCNTGIRAGGFSKQEMITWIGRIKRCFEYCKTEYVIYLEDDVLITKAITIDRSFESIKNYKTFYTPSKFATGTVIKSLSLNFFAPVNHRSKIFLAAFISALSA